MVLRIPLTNSERTTLQGCQHLWFLRYGLGLQPIGREPKWYLIGSWWHAAMEKLWASESVQEAIDVVDRLCERQVEELPSGFSMEDSWGESELRDFGERVVDMLLRYGKRWEGRFPGRLLSNEVRLTTRTKTPSGQLSPWTRYAGTLDKLVEFDNGALWIVEHKTSSRVLCDWRADNEYRPQADGYAWLVKRRFKREPAGVIYDLASTVVPPKPEAFRVTKKGDRLYKTLPTGTTATSFLHALLLNRFTLDDVPWYREVLPDLERAERDKFKRVKVRFAPERIKRVEKELWVVATQARRLREKMAYTRESLNDVIFRSPEDWRSVARNIIVADGWEYPRNGSYCRRWGRVCGFQDVCRYQSVEALEDFEVRRNYHPEHEEKS